MHREPSRAAPSSRENRGHRRLTAPLLPVSRADYCLSYMHNFTHTRACRQMYSSTRCCALGDLFISHRHGELIRMWNAHQRGLSSRARMGGVGGLYSCVCGYGMKHVLKLRVWGTCMGVSISLTCVYVLSRPLDHGVRSLIDVNMMRTTASAADS